MKEISSYIYTLFEQEWVFNTFLITFTSLIIIIGILLSDEIVMNYWRGYVIREEDGVFIGLSYNGRILFTAKEDKRRRKYVVSSRELNMKEPVPGIIGATFEIKELVDRRLKYHKGVIYRVTSCLLVFSFSIWAIVFQKEFICLLFFFLESFLLIEAEAFQKKYLGG